MEYFFEFIQRLGRIVQREHTKTEEEIKLPVSDIASVVARMRSLGTYVRTVYIRDVIYGTNVDSKKIRLRLEDNLEYLSIDATYKYRVAVEDGIKKEIEETVYKGSSFDEALRRIALQGDFKEQNSYEKTRILFEGPNDIEMTLDIYPFGVWLEIEGARADIHDVAKRLGFSKKDYIDASADDLYLAWIRRHGLPEMWDVRFGLLGKK